MSKGGLGKLLVGAGVGASIVALFTTKKGSEVREEIKKKFKEFYSNVEDLTVADIKKEFNDKAEEIKKGLEDLDKEKVEKIAKQKGKELQKKAEELVELAKEKGTPVLEDIASELREKTIAAAKEVIKKLEEK